MPKIMLAWSSNQALEKSSSLEYVDFWPQTNVQVSSRVGGEEALICPKFVDVVTSQRGVFIVKNGSSCLFCAILLHMM